MQERRGGTGAGGKRDVRETASSDWLLLSTSQRAEGLSPRMMLLRPVSSPHFAFLHSPQAAEVASQHTNACRMMVLMLL